MKKKEIFAISMLSLLVFVSIANVSVAAPPSYVGVNTGDEFIWRASLNAANLNATAIALFGLTNWTFMYEYFFEYFENATGFEFDFLTGAGVKAVMKNVTDEMPHPWMTPFVGSGLFFDLYVAYAGDNWELEVEAANSTSPMIFLLDPNALNESTILYAFSGMPLFMPIGYNYNMFANAYQTMIDSNPYMAGNFTMVAEGIGFKLTITAAGLETMFASMPLPFTIGTLSNAIITIRWNGNGVAEYASLEYGGVTLATAWLETTTNGEIPGFEIATIIGVSLVTILAVIYIRRKKNA